MKYDMRFLVALLSLFMLVPPVATEAQVPPSSAEITSYTGLHAAAAIGDADGVRRLVAEGADPEVRDRAGRTPLHVAAFASHDAVVRALAESGADVNALENDAYDIITIAVVADDPGMVRLALSLGADPGNITSRYDGTALIAAAHLGHAEVVRTLIAAGAPLDHVNNLGWTALIEAVILGDGGPAHVATAGALIAAGADVSITDRDGLTARMHAERMGYNAIAVLFQQP